MSKILNIVPNNLMDLLRPLSEDLGSSVYCVGGAVRDYLLGDRPKDYDFVVCGASYSDVVKCLSKTSKVKETGTIFRVLRVVPKDGREAFEVALPRKETSTGSGYKDWIVTCGPEVSIEEDLERRDFTLNAIAVDVFSGSLVDPLDGVGDLRNGVLRTTSFASFLEDPRRILRLARFVSRFGFEVEQKSYCELLASIENFNECLRDGTLPLEFIRKELLQIVSGQYVAEALDLLNVTGALEAFFPELARTVDCEQNSYHTLDVYGHTKKVVASMKSEQPLYRLAAIFHDIGKPGTRWLGEDGEFHFYKPDGRMGVVSGPEVACSHAELGTDITKDVLKRWRFPKKDIAIISGLVSEHMFSESLSLRNRRRLLRRLQEFGDLEFMVKGLHELRMADRLGAKTNKVEQGETDRFFLQLYEEMANRNLPTVSDLALSSQEMMDLGYSGPELGAARKMLLQHVIDDPSVNTKDALLRLLEEV